MEQCNSTLVVSLGGLMRFVICLTEGSLSRIDGTLTLGGSAARRHDAFGDRTADARIGCGGVGGGGGVAGQRQLLWSSSLVGTGPLGLTN